MPRVRSSTPPRRHGPLRCAGFAFAVVLAGCAVEPLPTLPRDAPAGWQGAVASPDASRPAPDLRGWWKAFADPELDRLVDAALADNLGLAQARLRLRAARGLEAHVGDAELPQFGFRTYAEPTPDSSASYFQAGFDAKWEFGLFGRRQSEARIAAGERAIADADAVAARVSVVAEVVRSYLDLRVAEHRQRLLDEVLVQARRRAELQATRARLRLASGDEVGRANADVAAAEAALAAPEAAGAVARLRLGVLLAAPDLALAPGELPTLHLDGRATDALPADLVRTRPEILRAEADVLKAAGELGIARADMFPRVGLGGALTYAARVIGHTRLSDADGIITFGPAIDIPLFDWGAREAARSSRADLLDASLLAYRQAVLEGVADVEGAMASLHARTRACVALEAGAQASAAAARAAATRERLGLADGIERATALDAQAQAGLALLDGERARADAFIALYKALGGAPLPAEGG